MAIATSAKISPFTVELAEEGKNSTITLKTLRLRLRGRFSMVNIHRREGGGRDVGPMNAMPDIPGIRITVDPVKQVAKIRDPVRQDEKLQAQIRSVMNRSQVTNYTSVKFVESSDVHLNDDQLVTLLLELVRKCEEHPTCAVLLEGKLPAIEQIEQLPGRELNDPMNSSATKPRYRDQLPEYHASLNQRM